MNSDFRDLLKLFNAHRVRYLVVGGYAVMKYTEPRYTKDLDIWVEASPKNARAVFRALRRFEAPLANLTEADFAKEGFCYQMGRPPARVDILMSIKGVPIRRCLVQTGYQAISMGLPEMSFPSGDLIANKQAVGRPHDMIDVSSLIQSEGRAAQRRQSRRRKKQTKGRKRGPDRKG